MNERIMELFDLAIEEFKQEQKYATIIIPNSLKEKFAELIVRECIKLAVPEDSYRDEWFKAKCDVMDRIKQHFGVE